MSELFREIDEELRRDRAAELWKRYGGYAIGAAIALVAGTGAFVAWRDYQHNQAAKQGAQFFSAAALVSSGKTDQALQDFSTLAANASSGYETLARMREAALKADSNDQAAAATYRAIADDSGVEDELRAAANLLAMLHALERIEPAELDRQIATLRADNNPWRHTAIELAALSAARTGQAAKARELYGKLADDPSAPAGLRARAAEMVAILGT